LFAGRYFGNVSSVVKNSAGAQRIVSFLPAATEMVGALGLADRLAGITHECDYPPVIAGKPVVVRSAIPLAGLSQAAIDAAVRERLRRGASLYEVDEALLGELAPDLILTQNLCQVCAPSGNEVSQALRQLPRQPQVLYLTPQSLADIFENLRAVGQATGALAEAERLIAAAHTRLEKISRQTAVLPERPRVFFMEWIDPIFGGGHWVPEMIELAGGRDSLGRRQSDSVRVTWEEVRQSQPEVLVIAPCGYNLQQTIAQTPPLLGYPGWADLPAVRQGRVFAVDANAYFARPGPRVVDGVELLAHLFHPGRFSWNGPANAFAALKDRVSL
jgi:iron complex transport system substrate-binding protein